MPKKIKWAVSKSTIVNDITSMLNSDVSDQAIGWLVSRAYSWIWADNRAEKGTAAKYKGCEYWSEAAKNLWTKMGNVPTGKQVIFEHVVPRSVLVEKLLNLRKDKLVTAEAVRQVFTDNCFACIVLVGEDKKLERKMPKEAASRWARYEIVPEIIVGKIENQNPENWQKFSLL